MDLSPSARASQINGLLADLKSSSCINPPAKLLQLKNIAKHPSGSQVLAIPHNLSLLLSFATDTYRNNHEARCEALRCIANCLLLVEEARRTFVDESDFVVVGEEIQGGQICLAELEKSTNHQVTFVLCRILFLSTVAPCDFLQRAVEHLDAVPIITTLLHDLTLAVVSNEAGAKEAMIDLLKLVFNFLSHYPKMAGEPQDKESENHTSEQKKVIGDFWSGRLDGLLPPLLVAFDRLAPTLLVNDALSNSTGQSSEDTLFAKPACLSPAPLEAPLTNIIHSLITIPINSGLKSIWLPPPPASTSGTSSDRKGKGTADRKSKYKSETSSPPSPSGGSSSGSRPISPTPPSGQKSASTLERALNVLSKTRRSLSRSPTPPSSEDTKPHEKVDVLARAFSLLDGCMELYLPDVVDPDDSSVRDRLRELHPAPPGTTASPDAASLDDPISPLLLLLSRLCIADGTCRRRLRSWLVPQTMDRSEPLETHASLLGRLLRVLTCVYHNRTKDAAGEMLYAMCNSDASSLSALVGYGNVAGFLFNLGIMSAPPPPQEDGEDDISGELPDPGTINPITGATAERKDTSVQDEMTEEEKEREMEKLFVLFDRLEKTGAIKPETNPMREAIKKGMAS